MSKCSWCQQSGSDADPLYPYDIYTGSRMHARCAIAAESGELPPSWESFTSPHGIGFQFLPPTPARLSFDPLDPLDNLRWMMNYIQSRYGSPLAALGIRPYDWRRDGL